MPTVRNPGVLPPECSEAEKVIILRHYHAPRCVSVCQLHLVRRTQKSGLGRRDNIDPNSP